MIQSPENTPSWTQRIIGIILLSAPMYGPLGLLYLFLLTVIDGNNQRASASALFFFLSWGLGTLVLYPFAMIGSILALCKGLRGFFFLTFALCTVCVPGSFFAEESGYLFVVLSALTAPLCLIAVCIAFMCYPKPSAYTTTGEGKEPSAEEEETTTDSSGR